MTTPLTNQEIYDRIYAAISERRLMPGTKLSEEKLAAAFHVSRTRIREVLFRLSQELIVELHPNRGAFIASPTHDDLHHVFQVRQALERGIVLDLCTRAQGRPIAALRRHLQDEARARGAGDRAELARLTGAFHVCLAQATGNRLYADNLRRLVALTGLVITQYGSHDSTACADHDHDEIVRTIEAGDAERCVRLMQRHLTQVEASIKAPEETPTEIDFGAIFGVDGAPAPPGRRGKG